MKNKFLVILAFCLAAIWILGTVPCFAENSMQDPAAKAQEFLDAILDYQGVENNTESVQAYIDGKLTDTAGSGAEWYILAFAQCAEYDFSSYEAALLDYLDAHTVHSASSRLKYALCLSAIGSTDGYISSVLQNSIGEQGVISYVFGLHLLNNGYTGETYTVSDLTEKLMELQREDGGWSITGQYGDVDATAMAVQALSLYYGNNDEIKEAVDNALLFLSERQLEDGDYVNYGVANPESTAQVLMALSSLGIDFASDDRFIKNGNTLFDGIEKYRLASGAFSHEEGGEVNETATVQVFDAMIAYLRMKNGELPFYCLDQANPKDLEPFREISSNEEEDLTEEDSDSGNYKIIACLVIAILSAVVCLALILCGKRHIKNFIAVWIITAIVLCAVFMLDFQSADDYYSGTDEAKENVIGTVTMTIRCDTVAGRKEYIPRDGVILRETIFEIEDGDTVYDILTEAARKYQIQIENDGNASIVYISGIQYLYEFDFGDLSGWVYTVNGERTSVGAGEYKLRDGDAIAWQYSCNLGEDLP